MFSVANLCPISHAKLNSDPEDIIVKITANGAAIFDHFHELKIFSDNQTLVNSKLGSYIVKKGKTKKILANYPDKQNRKKAFLSSAVGHAVQRRRCLHGLCHGSQCPWLTSPVLSASPAVARARRALNHLHPLVTSGSANNSVCFCRELLLLWACPLHGTETVHGGTCGACTVGCFQPGYELWAKR